MTRLPHFLLVFLHNALERLSLHHSRRSLRHTELAMKRMEQAADVGAIMKDL